MNAFVGIQIGPMDHPLVETGEDDEGSAEITIRLSETMWISGPAGEVRRWVEEVVFRVQTL